MLLTSWLSGVCRSVSSMRPFTGPRSPVRRRDTTLRRLANSLIEGLEDRSLLSAVVGASIDVASHQLLIFDPTTGTQTGQVAIPNGAQNSDIVISPDGNFAYVSVFQEQKVYVVDLNTKSLASGTNPIAVATPAEDLAITPDGKYLLVVDGGNISPIVVVDTATRATVSVTNDGIGHSAVEVTANGDVLVGSVNNGTTRHYQIDGAGQLSFTGQSISSGGQNVIAAPNGVSGIEADSTSITSFAISSMSSVSHISPGGNVQSLVLSPDGSKLFVRTSTNIIGYNYNQASGQIGSQILSLGGLATASGFYGTDQLDITPDGARLYTSSGSQVLAFGATSGSFLGSINPPNSTAFVGIDIAAAASGPGTVTGTKYNDLDGDGVRDVNEPGLPGWIIYADLDNDSTRDANEPFTTTDANGNYVLAIESGTYTLREEPQAGWIQTSPRAGLYATGNNGTSLISINSATGTSAVIGPFGANSPTTFAGAFTPDGTFWTISNSFDSSLSRLATVNLATGALTKIGGTNWTGSPIVALEADAAGNLYAGNFSGTFFSVNKATGQLTPIGNMGITSVKDFTFDNQGRLWAVAGNHLYEVNPLTGTTISGPTITGTNAEVQGIMVDPLTGVFYASTYTGASQFYTIDITTGIATLVGSGLGIVAPNGGDFMPLSANRGQTVTVNAGTTAAGHDFGNRLDQGTITGTKYNDLDGDGVRDVNEPGLPGWTIYADLDHDGTRDGNEPYVVTGANGEYSLPLPSGSYTIREEIQAGWNQTAPEPRLFSTGNNASNLIAINPLTGTGTIVGPSGLFSNDFGNETVFGGAITPDGTFWTIINAFDSSTARLGKSNLDTGAVTTVGTPNWSGSPLVALEADASGNLYAANFDSEFFSVNQSTGQLTPIGNLGVNGVKDLTFDNSGNLWAVSANHLFQVNLATGAATPGPIITGTNTEVLGIMVDPITGVFYASTYASNSQFYTVDLATGIATPVGPGIGITFPVGGDFTPLSVSRGLSVVVNAGSTLAGRDFGNQIANSAPIITSAATASVPENSTAVIQVIATDLDIPVQSITYSIAGGTDADLFTIDPVSGLLAFITAPDFEAPAHPVGTAPYQVIVTAADNGSPSRSVTQTIAVTVTDVNEVPSIVSSDSASVIENATAVLTVLAADVDLPAQSLTFSIAGGDDASQFTIDATTGALSFITAPNFEQPADADGDSVYNVTVMVSDSGTPQLFATQAIAVTVTDINEAPTIISSESASVTENTTAVLTVLAGDVDLPAQSLTFAIAGGDDASRFTIDATTGVLSFITAPNFEQPADADGDNIYNVTVMVSDSGTPQLFATQAVAVTVTDINEAPTIVSSDSASVTENTTVVLTVLAGDVDLPSQSLTFAIAGGDDASRFTIDPATGVLSFITAPDFEAPADSDGNNLYLVTVKVTDNGTPSQFATQAITIGVTDVPAAIVSILKVADGTEANPASTGKFRVIQSAVSSADTVVHYSISGTAVSGVDYSALTGTATIPAGQTSVDINVTVVDDTLVEGPETVAVTLTDLGMHNLETSLDAAPAHLTASVNIVDNDVSTLTISSPTITEGNSGSTTMTFVVSSPTAIPGGFTVAFNVANISTESNDYTLVTSSPLTFSGTAGETRTITVNVLGDLNSETNETLAITLGTVIPGSSELASSIISGAVGIGTIINDDIVTFTLNNATASESAGALNFNLVADKAFDLDVTMTVTFSGGTATGSGVDYVGTSQQVTFLAGQKIKTVSVPIINDNLVEPTEMFTVTLSPSAPLDGRLVNVSDTGTGTITDNDSATVSIAEIADGTESSSPVDGVFRVTQSAPSSTDTVVNYSISGTATAGGSKDYSVLSGSVTILAGQTTADITVDVLDDALVEATETVIVTLSSFGTHDPDVTLSSAAPNRKATVNITDTDVPTFTTAAVTSVPENTSTSTVVLDVNVNTSLIPSATITFSISGPDAASFKINSSTGQITFRSIPNYEAPADLDSDNVYQLTVTATTNTVPARSASQALTINVSPVNDFTPVFANTSSTFSIAENSEVGTLVGGVSATDGDLPPQILTYSIVGGNSSGAFAIDPITGQITVVNSTPLNYEVTTRFTLTVRVSDNGSPAARTANATVTVNLTNVIEGPTIVIPTPAGSYHLGSPYEFIASNGSFTYEDLTSPNYNGAKLTVSISSGRLSNDVLSIVSAGTGSNQISTANGKVYFGSTQIGTFTGGSDGNPNLVVTFNSNATTVSVSKLVQRLSLVTNGAAGTSRRITAQIKGIGTTNSNLAACDIMVV
jgi:hypothetical protein